MPPLFQIASAVALAHRAVPVAWCVMGRSQFTRKRKSRNDAEEQIICLLKEAFGEHPWVLVADRGFARADLFGKLQDWGVRYVIRACGNPWVEVQGWAGRLWDIRRASGQAQRYKQVFYHRTSRVPVSLVVAHREPAPEPRYLITNLEGTKPVVEAYRRRVWIEEHFRDAQSGMGFDGLRMATAKRMERLLILMVIAMLVALMTALNWTAHNAGRDSQLTTHKRGRSLSMFMLGLQLLRAYGLPGGFTRFRLTRALEAI